MSAISRRRIAPLWPSLRAGGTPTTLNWGYGHGFSVMEVIDTVRRVSGRNFVVQHAARRPGDSTAVVADISRIRATLDWTPRYDDLDTIAAHALAWEHKLMSERGFDPQQLASA
jgi:UDP-glucose 4-epimerase